MPWLTIPHPLCPCWFESQPLSSQSWNRMTSKPTNPHHLPLFSPSAYMAPSKHYDLVETLKPLTPSLSHYPVVPHVHSLYSVRWQAGCALGELHLKYNRSLTTTAERLWTNFLLKKWWCHRFYPPSVPVVAWCHTGALGSGAAGQCPVHFCPCLPLCVSTKSQMWWSQIAWVLFAVVMMQFS